MPRNFLVKRTKHSNSVSYRERRVSDEIEGQNVIEPRVPEDQITHSGTLTDCENANTKFGSPDSGYSVSPLNLVMVSKDAENNNYDIDDKNKTSECLTFTPTKSPLTVSTNSYPSPFYYSTFDRLSVSSNISPAYSPRGSPSQSPNKRRGQSDNENKPKSLKKPKAARKINFDEDKSSPVSGCIIKDLSECEDGKVVYGDIDSSYNYVEVTPEARAAIEKIENKIGDYICRLCKEHYDDAFKLAQHRCPRIVHVEYRCPECDKVFSCPANLASHRRWHKPRQSVPSKQSVPSRILPANVNLNQLGNLDNSKPALNLNKQILSITPSDLRNSPSDEGQYHCETCGKTFRRQAYLRKHVLNHANDQQTTKTYNEPQNNNISNINDCSVCPTNLTLDKSVRVQNNDIYKCKYCASSFFSSPGLTRHINKCHPTENPQVILLQIPPSVSRPC